MVSPQATAEMTQIRVHGRHGVVASADPRRPAAARSIRGQHQAHHLRRDELLGPELPVNDGIHEHPPGRVCSRTGRR